MSFTRRHGILCEQKGSFLPGRSPGLWVGHVQWGGVCRKWRDWPKRQEESPRAPEWADEQRRVDTARLPRWGKQLRLIVSGRGSSALSHEFSRFQSVEIHPAGESGCIEANFVDSCGLLSVHEDCHFSSEQVVYAKTHMCLSGNSIAQRSCRIEWVRVVRLRA